MKPISIELIYKAMNAIASGKHDPETEQCLSDAIEEELFATNASVALDTNPARLRTPWTTSQTSSNFEITLCFV
jgi:hypothetical protein